MKLFVSLSLVLAPLCSVFAAQSVTAGKAQHVVVVVWDGMRPDFITPQYTPPLLALARRGVFFKKHQPVYISPTEVNGAANAAGPCPALTGIIANRDYRPELNWQDSLGTET